MFLTKAKEIVFDILFPQICVSCERYLEKDAKTKKERDFLCDRCYQEIKLNTTLFCPICRARLADNKKICHPQSQYLLGAASNYDNPPIQNLIHYFKYKSFKNIAPILGEILIKYLDNILLDSNFSIPDSIIIPIPLHPSRQKQRGFNQAKLIGEALASHFNLPLKEPIKRVRNNKPQVGLRDNEERLKNMEGSFRINDPEIVKNKNIIIVDDVFTSGATINEAVRLLKSAEARKIIALVLAKT